MRQLYSFILSGTHRRKLLISAAEQLNRNCFMMKYSPIYIDVTVKRLEALTGKKAVYTANIENGAKWADEE